MTPSGWPRGRGCRRDRSSQVHRPEGFGRRGPGVRAMSGREPVRIGVVGATGLGGGEMLRILEERSFPVAELRGYASARSEGRKLPFAGGEITCQVLKPGCFDGLDIVVVDVDDPLA